MFKQMGIKNLKYITVLLFSTVIMVGGFFVNTQKVDAVERTQPFSYSLSSVYSYDNNVGGITTVVRVGCFRGSGDKYDINTGKPCSYITSGHMIGCAIGSGDKYDINTGKICLYLTSNVIIGCSSNSTDKYDINTGKLCIVENSILKINQQPTINSPIITTTTTTTEGPSNTIINNPTLSKDELTKAPLTEGVVNNNLKANTGGIRSIFTWPMSTRGITILILIILAIGYGIYSLIRKDKSNNIPLHVEQPKNPANTISQNKIPNTPLTSQTNNPSPQMPLNNIASNPNQQEQVKQTVK